MTLVSLAGDKLTIQSNFIHLLFAITLAHRTVNFETIMDTLEYHGKHGKKYAGPFRVFRVFRGQDLN